MPAAEVEIDDDLVRALLAEQHPDLADLSLSPLAFGWDNVVYRLGTGLTVRLPRREMAVPLIEHEQRWLPVLAPSLPLAVPAPTHLGRAGCGYPWPWSICPWIPGEIAARTPLGDPVAAAEVLGSFLRALHVPAPADFPPNPYRGVPLAARSELFEAQLDRVDDSVDATLVRARWERALAVAPWAGPPVWLHGDMHPANILVLDGHLSGVVDFGDMTAGDPATDLSVAWMLLPPHARPALRKACGDIDDNTWARARGWALNLALAFLSSSADNVLIHKIGERTLAAVLADDS